MGPHLMSRPPKFVQAFLDQHGKPRFYFRRPGFPRVPLPGLPWSPEFMAAYEAALAGQPAEVGNSRTKPGTIRAVAVSYFNSIGFHGLSPSTQAVYRRLIEGLCRQHGDKRAATLQREHVIKLMAARAGRPTSANGLRKILRILMTHAVETGLRSDDPTRDVKAVRIKSDGFHSWTDAEVSRFEQHHRVGSRARLALALLLFTGQRRSDVVRMGRQHIRGGFLEVKQVKTGVALEIPVVAELEAIIDSTATEHMTFLTTQFGRPFTAAGFSHWFRKQCDAAGLPYCSAHGLRKAAARRLAEAGCTAHEIAAVTGHASLREITNYTKAVDQRRLATAAMDKAKARTSSVKLATGFDKNRKF
jgi:integrase